jgi:hypothetical protein
LEEDLMMQVLDAGDPYSHAEIIDKLQHVNGHIASEFGKLTTQQFFTHTPGVWSPAENLQHLIISVDATTRGLSLPKLVLRTRFGTADQPSRRYNEVKAVYQKALNNGGAASGQFIPQTDNHPDDPQAEQARLVQSWTDSSAALVRTARKWNETQLDSIRLPHPLIGLLTARELLAWTIYHNLHHLDDVRRLLEST